MVRACALCCALRSATLMWIACYGGDYLSAPIRAFGPTFEYEIPTQMFCRAFLGAEPHPSPHPAPPPHCRYYSKYSPRLEETLDLRPPSSSSQSDDA